MEKLNITEGITFDDVLLVPRFSNVTPDEADTSTRLTNRISLNIPLISAPMDTVTESALAIALAQEGGIGIVHKNMPPHIQALEVAKVKRSENGVITDPITLGPEDSIAKATALMAEQNVSGFPVTLDGEGTGEVVGILTRRDMKFVDSADQLVKELMTSENLVKSGVDTTLEEAEAMMTRARVEKLILVDDSNKLSGLVTMRDIENIRHHPKACRDSRGRLRVGAAVGVHQFDRVEALIEAEVDLVIVDTAHGHSQNVIDTVKEIKSRWDIDVVAGNIATTEGAEALIEAGVDAVKVGIGPESISTKRMSVGFAFPN